MKKIAIYNIKGGVGKTTTSITLACMLAKVGLSVLVWDFDPQGGSSYFFENQNKNDNKYNKLFDRQIEVYDVIQPTSNLQIDLISNDSFLSDTFVNKASRLTILNFINKELVKLSLKEVEEDYDVCIMDCSPGKSTLHDNIFFATDLILVPNIPAPLSIYCNHLILEMFKNEKVNREKMFSFYNMVQIHKILHKQFLNQQNTKNIVLKNYIPFNAEIESITYNRELINKNFRDIKISTFYDNLWNEICDLKKWDLHSKSESININFNNEVINSNIPLNNNATLYKSI